MKILFIFHEANLTGATLSLFGNVKWYSDNTDITMHFLLKENGILNNEISQIGTVYLWQKENSTNKSIFRKVLCTGHRGFRDYILRRIYSDIQ